MRALMSTDATRGNAMTGWHATPEDATHEAARMMERTEPETVWQDEDGEPEMRSGFRHGGWLIEACLADSLRAFDAMTLDDVAALQR